MQKTDYLPEIKLKEVCPGCGRKYPFNLQHFEFCLICQKIFCLEKCMRKCIMCGRSRCFICLEQIESRFRSSGKLCEKCAAQYVRF